MLARTNKNRKVSIAVAVFLIVSIFLAFGVVGDEVSEEAVLESEVEATVEEPVDVVEESVEEPPVEGTVGESVEEQETGVEADKVEEKLVRERLGESGEVYVDLDEVEESQKPVEKEVAQEENETEGVEQNESGDLYADLDDVLEDKGIEEIAEVTDEDVRVDLSHIEQKGSSSGGSSNKKVVEEAVEKVVEENVGEDKEEISLKKKKTRVMGDVVMGGEYTRKEIMRIEYNENEESVVSKIERLERTVAEDERELKKEVVVSSGNEHFSGEIVYHSYLEKEADSEEQILINWKNENKEVDFEAFDENDNGLIDKVSWTIPHLSVQEFEIIVNFDVSESNFSAIELAVDESPVGNVTSGTIDFQFDVGYHNTSLVLCNLTIVGEGAVVFGVVDGGGSEIYSADLGNGEYDWSFVCFDTSNESVRNETGGDFFVSLSYSPIVSLEADPVNIQEGESVDFDINISAPFGTPSFVSYMLYYGDGDDDEGVAPSASELSAREIHEYDSAGTYHAVLNSSVQYEGGGIFSTVESVTIEVTEPSVEGDTSAPDIELNEPRDEEFFNLDNRNQEISFSYNVTDDVKIENCTFEMFYYNDSMFGEEVVNEFKDDISNGSTITYEYKDFDEGDYSWDVECYDNSSNKGGVSDRDFSVSYGSDDSDSGDDDSDSGDGEEEVVALSAEEQARVDEVQELVDSINDFFVEEEGYGAEQVEAIEDLEIDETLQFYKKKLLQMKLDLEHNLDYIRDEERREERRSEIFDEMEEMRKNIPTSFSVEESHEYFKNALEADLEDIVSAYVEAKGIVIGNREIRKLAEQTDLLQNQITVSVNTKKISVDYLDGGDEEFILVSKEIDFKSKDFDSLIEVVPKEVSESASDLSFIVESKPLREDPVIEIQLDNLGDREKLVYTISSNVKLSEIEKTTTLAFKEDIPESTIGGVTGFVSFVGGGDGASIGFYISWILAIAGLFVLGTFSYRKIKVQRLKKHKDVRALFEATSETEKLLKRREIEMAREKYQEAKEIYPKIPDYGKKVVYNKLQKLYLAIDKKDIVSMVKEFMNASKEGRKENALMIYRDIQKLYPRMPKRFKQKVFERMQPHLSRLSRL